MVAVSRPEGAFLSVLCNYLLELGDYAFEQGANPNPARGVNQAL